MKNFSKYIGWMLLFFSSLSYAWQWKDLWQTADQRAAHLLKVGKSKEAAQTFVNPDWRAVASYRAEDYAHAYHYFSSKQTSDAQYNAGNAAAFLGHYKAAIDAYDKALVIHPGNKDAIFNRDIVKKLAEKQKDSSKNSQKNSSNQQNEKKNNDNKNENNNKPDEKNNKSQDKQQNQPSKEQQSSQAKNEKQQPADKATSTDQLPAKDEDKKQLLRRIADDPGGLLRQKFLRDYFRRHTAEGSIQEDS